jgi:hypothetical protein
MTPERFSEVMDTINWTLQQLSAVADRDYRLVRGWMSGRTAIPQDIAVWLEKLAAAHEANPPPAKPPVRVYPEAADR